MSLNSYDRSNIIRLTWSGNQVEDHTNQNCLEFHQDADHARILNRRRSVLGIIHTIFFVAVCWKVQIQPDIASHSTDGEIICMYNAVKKTSFTTKDIHDLISQCVIIHGGPCLKIILSWHVRINMILCVYYMHMTK